MLLNICLFVNVVRWNRNSFGCVVFFFKKCYEVLIFLYLFMKIKRYKNNIVGMFDY